MADTDYLDLLVYSDDSSLRKDVIDAVGSRPGKGLPKARWTEAATAAGAQDKVHNGKFDALVLDGETTKVSGMVLAKTLLDQEDDVPPMIILVARPQDEWLARFSGAARSVALPVDPLELQEALADLLS
ncbi:MAG: two-component system response regulator [Actinomycetaceae bacterium]|nr:two-component system response regulator [Actinomycetaceae bacterium]MDU0969387.1 two-component system response regulator [Actinomycetaceae bacterium]